MPYMSEVWNMLEVQLSRTSCTFVILARVLSLYTVPEFEHYRIMIKEQLIQENIPLL